MSLRAIFFGCVISTTVWAGNSCPDLYRVPIHKLEQGKVPVKSAVKKLLNENGLEVISWAHGVPVVDKREGMHGISGVLVDHIENEARPVDGLEMRYLATDASQGMILYAQDPKTGDVVFAALPPGHETMRPEPAAYAKRLYEGLEIPPSYPAN